MRYDDTKEIYRDCRWCHGEGCLYCKAERDKAYKSDFPDGLKPLGIFENTPEGLAKLKDLLNTILPPSGQRPE